MKCRTTYEGVPAQGDRAPRYVARPCWLTRQPTLADPMVGTRSDLSVRSSLRRRGGRTLGGEAGQQQQQEAIHTYHTLEARHCPSYTDQSTQLQRPTRWRTGRAARRASQRRRSLRRASTRGVRSPRTQFVSSSTGTAGHGRHKHGKAINRQAAQKKKTDAPADTNADPEDV